MNKVIVGGKFKAFFPVLPGEGPYCRVLCMGNGKEE